MKKLNRIQLLKSGKSLDDYISDQTNLALSNRKMKKILGGVDSSGTTTTTTTSGSSCDAVCLPSEMGGNPCSCLYSMIA